MKKIPSYFQIGTSTLLLATIVFVVLIILNISLYLQNHQLYSAIYKGEMSLSVGKSMKAISGTNISGEDEVFEWRKDNRKTVLFVFSNGCKVCLENIPNWKAIVSGIDKNKFRLIGVAGVSEGVEKFREKAGMQDIPIIANAEPSVYNQYLFNITPQTVLLDSEGKIEKLWLGGISSEQRESIESSLGVKLPE